MFRNAGTAAAAVFLAAAVGLADGSPADWDDVSLWEINPEAGSSIVLRQVPCESGDGIELNYALRPGSDSWAEIQMPFRGSWSEKVPVTFRLKADSSASLEIKLEDEDGTTFIRRVDLKDRYKDWERIVVYLNSLRHAWGGDRKFGDLARVYLAVAGRGNGTLWLDQVGLGKPGLKASFSPLGPDLDPDRKKRGFGFRQRRHKEMSPEDPLVYEWIKRIQDESSPDKKLLPSMEDGVFQTFNNSLAAMAFVLKGDRERAERILDFYSDSADPGNKDPNLQNFYYIGQERGFFQNAVLKGGTSSVYAAQPGSDRWTGDMAWLLIAYQYYGKVHGPDRYQRMSGLLKNLILSFYKEAPPGGYIRHGWRNGDAKIHEDAGHPEGNLDCYAALRLAGEEKTAAKIRQWLDANLEGDGLPLDLYTWRALAYGKEAAAVLDVPEHDLRFRKILEVRGQPVMGFFHTGADSAENIWLDGTGHMACAFFEAGTAPRGNFYADQMDPFLIERNLGGVITKALPYTANQLGGYDWVDLKKGFISPAVWYIFAKNRFNPLKLETH